MFFSCLSFYNAQQMDIQYSLHIHTLLLVVNDNGQEVCRKLPGGKLNFYLETKGKRTFLFTQKYSAAVANEFKTGKTAEELRRFHRWGGDRRVDKTVEKIPMYIAYVKQEGLV